MKLSSLTAKVKSMPRTVRTAVIAGAGVTVAIIGSVLIAAMTHHSDSRPLPGSHPNRASQVLERHLSWADERSDSGLTQNLQAVHEFFETARSRTPTYAVEVLGWESKFTLVKGFLSSDQSHEQYMKDRFAAILFSEAELDEVVRQCITGYISHCDDIEGQMLVSLEADLAELPVGDVPAASLDRATLHQTLQTALHESTAAAQADFRGMVGREVVSWVASEVLTLAAAELATSAGILGTGAASSWGTFGMGIVVGLIVDSIVTEIYNKQFDPAGELSRKLDSSLHQMESLILKGADDRTGLNGRLRDYSSRRNSARREAIQRAVLTTTAI